MNALKTQALVKALLNRGWKEIEAGEAAAAAVTFRRCVSMLPQAAEAWYGLGMALHDQQKLDEAMVCYQQAQGYNPNLNMVWNAIGDLESSRQKYAEAIDTYRQALALEPGSLVTRRNLSQVLNSYGNEKRQDGFPRQALDAYREAHELDPDEPVFAFNLGLAYADLGEISRACKAYRSALAKDATLARAYGNLAYLLRESAHIENRPEYLAEAEKLYLKALNLDPDNKQVRDNLRRLRYLDLNDPENAIPALNKELKHCDDDFNQWRTHLLLSHLLDKSKLYSQAFTHAAKAHEIAGRNQHFRAEAFNKQIDNLVNFFSSEFFTSIPTSENLSEKPVFIVGMPRSGSTLTEQILAAHPDIATAGEQPYISILAEKLPAIIKSTHNFPECLSEINRDNLTLLADAEEKRLLEFSPKAQRITCKLPGNFLYLGLIAVLFPKARIIHCRRRPADTIISIFLQNFVAPLSYSHKITDLIHYYQGYRRIMVHWQTTIDLEIFEISYETLVSDQEQQSRKLMQFLDLEWNEACLDFYKQPQLVITASRDQVKRPIYKSSLKRWLNYKEELREWRSELDRLNRDCGY